MNPILNWSVDNKGFKFTCIFNNELIPTAKWALYDIHLKNGDRAYIEYLIMLTENEDAIENENDIFVDHSSIAEFAIESPDSLTFIGLPEAMPYSLSIEHEGTVLLNKDFSFKYSMWHPNGRSVMGCEITGSLLSINQTTYIIPNPYFTLIKGMDKFNSAPPETNEDRFEAWSSLQNILPKEAKVNETLKNMRIYSSNKFSLKPFVNSNGEPDFDPVPILYKIEDEIGSVDTKNIKELLPSKKQDKFAEYFRKLKTKRGYSLSGGAFLVISESSQKLLSVIKKIQTESPEIKRSFLNHPHAFFRKELGDEFADNNLDKMFFCDDELSKRVTGIGIFQEKVLPQFLDLQSNWIPVEDIESVIDIKGKALNIGGNIVKIEDNEIEDLINNIEEALDNGEPTIKFKDTSIPVSPETLKSLKHLKSTKKNELKQAGADDKLEPELKNVLQVQDNIDGEVFNIKNADQRNAFFNLPNNLNYRPKKYQKPGIRWLQEHWVKGSPGALLADDMGLGKTYQTLSFLMWLKNQKDKTLHEKPILVVAPTGLLKNWIDEHDRHLSALGLGERCDAFGSSLKNLKKLNSYSRNELHAGFPVLDINKLKQYDWVLTTYQTLRDYQHSFGRVKWSVLIFDEAQAIKNPCSLVTEAAKAINSLFKVAITGTPIENRLSDLWCIADTVQPGRLKSLKDFHQKYEKKHKNIKSDLKKLKYNLTDDPKPPLMLRRLKSDHLDGMPKVEKHLLEIDMPEEQAKAYSEVIATLNQFTENEKGKVLEVIHKIRNISLYYKQKSEELDESYIESSARLKATFEKLDLIRKEDEKVLIFLESRYMQSILVEIIQRRYKLPNRPSIINGTISGHKRKEKVDLFEKQQGFGVMLLSPQAGGVGLTITAANHVIHLSRWWNPAVEDQCTDRVVRIGQTRDVNIYYPLAVHPQYKDSSFDIVLSNLLEKKRKLAKDLLLPTPSDEDIKSDIYSKIKNSIL